LQRCCRVLRTIFSGEWLWEQLCADLLADEDLCAKPAHQAWRSFYASWAPTPQGWLRAYATIARQLVEEGALSMSLRFEGGDSLPEWQDAECLKVKDIRVTDFGVTGYAGFDEAVEPPPGWDISTGCIRGARVVARLGGAEARDCTVLAVDCSDSDRESVPSFLEWVQCHLGVKCAGLHLSRTFWVGIDEGDEMEVLDIKVMIPTPRLLECILGPDRMRQWAAELLGIGGLGVRCPSDGLALFAELRQKSPGEQPVVARIRTAVPAPSWRDLRRDFFFRRGYKHVLREACDDPQPMPSFDFTFDFEEARECSSDRFLLSFWCIDASGRTSFASHLIPFDTNPTFELSGRKAQCAAYVPAVIKPDCDWKFILAKLTVRSGPHQLPVHRGASPGVHRLHLIVPPFRLPECFDRDECLRAALADYARRQARRGRPLAGAAPEALGDAAESDSESDREEERSWWECRAALEQESLACKLSWARVREPAGSRRAPPLRASPWRGLAPLRRCRACRCILTRLLVHGGLERELCVRCGS